MSKDLYLCPSTMIDLEIKLLSLFARDKTNHTKVSEIVKENRNNINDIGVNGPFFNLLLGMRVFLTTGLVIELLQYGFDLSHKNNKHTVHKAIVNSLTNYYSNELYDVLEILLSSARFLETINDDNIVDILLKTDNDPDPLVIALLLKYDKDKRIKIQLLKNTTYCTKFKNDYPAIYELITNY